MKELDKTQKLLESLSPKPLPPQLRERILLSAYQKQRKFQVITPALRTVFFICCILIIMAFISETMITKSENERLTAIIEISHPTEAIEGNGFQEMIAELFEMENEHRLTQWLIWRFKIKEKAAKLVSFQSISNRLKEEINGI